MTIIVHHLENSRSQRILWMLEELGLPYEVKRYERNKKTMLAPPELKRVHPLGKSPVIEDSGTVVAETGAIIEYLVEKADGRLGRRVGCGPDSGSCALDGGFRWDLRSWSCGSRRTAVRRDAARAAGGGQTPSALHLRLRIGR